MTLKSLAAMRTENSRTMSTAPDAMEASVRPKRLTSGCAKREIKSATQAASTADTGNRYFTQRFASARSPRPNCSPTMSPTALLIPCTAT